ncbi:MAG: GDSL-type esterase/lipase family protein [Chitinispirillia bacterium]
MDTCINTNAQFITVTKINKTSIFRLTFLLFVIIMSSTITAKTVLVCVGNSITERIPDSGGNYVTQLTQILGYEYEVINFGVSGRTMSKKGDFPYWKEEYFKEIFSMKPDIITIMLGTNDARICNWKVCKEYFKEDAQAMVDSILTISPKPSLLLALPPPAFFGKYSIKGDLSIKGEFIEELVPMLREVAEKSGVHVIDAHTPMDSSGYFADGLHPNLEGHTLLANIFFESLTIITSISNKMVISIQNNHSKRPVVKIGIINPTCHINNRVSRYNIFVLDHGKIESSQKIFFLLSGRRITTTR